MMTKPPRRLRLVALGVLLTLLAAVVVPGRAQSPERPVVAFVFDSRIRTAATNDPRDDGITKLVQIFRDQGANTLNISLLDPVPEAVQVVVLVHPRIRLPMIDIVHLWLHIQRGGHVLFATDPNYQNGVNSDAASGGMFALFNNDYGISVQEALVAEPGFTRDAILDIGSTFSRVIPENNDHPILAPLHTHNLAVQIWGARPMRVEPFGLDSYAIPLLYSPTAFGETGRVFFSDDPPVPVEFTPGKDDDGWINVAALAENTATGSRIAMLNDSEIVQNGYGLAYIGGTDDALHLGDWIFAQRLAAWLMGLPESEWPDLPSNVTWLLIDGAVEDWDAYQYMPVVQDTVGDAASTDYDIQQAVLFQNDDFLYVLVETQTPPADSVQLRLEFDTDFDTVADTTVVGAGDQVTVSRNGEILSTPDAQFQTGAVIEMRVPLRTLGVSAGGTALCLLSSESSGAALDCVERALAIQTVVERAPDDLDFGPDFSTGEGLLVRVAGDQRINVRTAPSTESGVVAVYAPNTMLVATGRNEAGDWIQVQNARMIGWVADFLLAVNGDLSTLPVVEEAAP
ncbi:MAG: hypothetical protein JXQ72_02605 [Anaerolineae bacterium]|nr:hypothetical protein [Anaerolineae bacterium]